MKQLIAPSSIAFDIDGVVADTMTLFRQIAKHEYGIIIRYKDITDYDLTKALDLDFTLYWNIIEQILNGNTPFPLKPINDAKRVLGRLIQYTDYILFVTARPSSGFIHQWIINELELLESKIKVIATGSFEEKASHLHAHHKTFFVEDRIETCFLLQKEKIQPIVFSHPWNQQTSHSFLTVDSWGDLEAVIDFSK